MKKLFFKLFKKNSIDPNSCPNNTPGCNGTLVPVTEGGLTICICNACGRG